MTLELTFFVAGTPQTAGSKSSVPITKGDGQVVGRRVIESGTKTSRARKKTWRGDLRDAATDALAAGLDSDAVGRDWPGGPEHALYVRFVFVRKRPSTHLTTGKNGGQVKDWALGLRPTTRPDALKLARAAEDALTGVLWADDSQIVAERLDKAFGDQVTGDPRAEGLLIVVRDAGPYEGPTLVRGAPDSNAMVDAVPEHGGGSESL